MALFMETTHRKQLSIVYLGMDSLLSQQTLHTLLTQQKSIDQIISFNDTGKPKEPEKWQLPVTNFPVEPSNSHTLKQSSLLFGVPIQELTNQPLKTLRSILTSISPDLLLVCCFPQKLPYSILTIPKMGCFNLHPSLLPSYRGPSPLFWQFRNGIREFGVTIHQMERSLDTGEIILQDRYKANQGESGILIERKLSTKGGKLFADLIGFIQQKGRVPTFTSDEPESYFGWPLENDFCITTDWSCHQAINFFQGVKHLGYPILIKDHQHKYRIYNILGYEPWGKSNSIERQGDFSIYIKFSTGILEIEGEIIPNKRP